MMGIEREVREKERRIETFINTATTERDEKERANKIQQQVRRNTKCHLMT
jgi:hypothetical protein